MKLFDVKQLTKKMCTVEYKTQFDSDNISNLMLTSKDMKIKLSAATQPYMNSLKHYF